MALEAQALEALRPQLDSIPEKDLHRLPGPAHLFIHSCERVRARALRDLRYYQEINFDVVAAADDLEQSTAAFRETDRLWLVESVSSSEADTIWSANRDGAYALRRETIKFVDDCLKDAPNHDRSLRLKKIRNSSGHPDMIADLGALAELAAELAPELAARNFGPDKIAELSRLHLLLNGVYGAVIAGRSGTSPGRILRDRAYVFTLSRLNRIKDKAALALRNHPDLLEQYTTTASGTPPEAAASAAPEQP